jgi:hypothetical protein
MKLELRKFDMSRIADDKVVVMIGARGTGKSFLMRDLLYHHQDIPIGCVISPTEIANHWFSSFVPPSFVYEEYTPEILARFVQRQKMATAQCSKEARSSKNGTSSLDPRAFLVLDDCLYNKNWVKDKNVRFIFQNGRHVKCLFLFSMQFPLGVTPELRTNIDYVFVLRDNIMSNRKRIYESYAGIFPTFDVFCQVLTQTTNNYECLVIDNTSKSNKLEDCIFWYKAQPHPDFRMGAPAFWAEAALAASAGTKQEDNDGFPDAAELRPSKGPKVDVVRQPDSRAAASNKRQCHHQLVPAAATTTTTTGPARTGRIKGVPTKRASMS